MSFKELNAQIVFLEKQATSCTDEDHRKDIKESISQIYAKIKTIIANTNAEVTVKTENAGVNQNFRIIERTLASLPIFHGTDTVEAPVRRSPHSSSPRPGRGAGGRPAARPWG